MKSFIDSLRHACKVPNADQPFACADLMYLATLLDTLAGLKQGSVLRAVGGEFLGGKEEGGRRGFTGDWPLAAAFHVYENGL